MKKRSRINVLKRHIDIQRLTKNYYVEGMTTYKGIWQYHIEPIYHISYMQYMRILGIGGLKQELADEMARLGQTESAAPSNQLSLLDVIEQEQKEQGCDR